MTLKFIAMGLDHLRDAVDIEACAHRDVETPQETFAIQSQKNMSLSLTRQSWKRALQPIAALLLVLAQPVIASTAELIASPEPGWPQFRGPRRDGISEERNLLQTWPEAGPALAWTAPGIGRGF